MTGDQIRTFFKPKTFQTDEMPFYGSHHSVINDAKHTRLNVIYKFYAMLKIKHSDLMLRVT